MPNIKGQIASKVPPPLNDIIRPLVVQFAAAGYSNPQIVSKLKEHYDTNTYNFL
ncbi:hypothetical protein SERLA73DRAFT_73260 [Serpula lacrymans var. lacrymans S7.3]|uniref:Uncharacterized protein n=1 Tax=Serpula lacrymans var. lacrymans (strain S7.3) TaxID=936435 RepID=F8PXN7_SERL3|nr:hypothetical protein SERLA73DRAFT_73260 [Serpula lacrymans var. lacrymans S7.3]